MDLESSVGFTTILVGRGSLSESIQHHASTGVHVLTSGAIPPNPTEILQSKAARALFMEVRETFDIVIIDSPPLLPVADAAILAVEADGALLVSATRKDQSAEPGSWHELDWMRWARDFSEPCST